MKMDFIQKILIVKLDHIGDLLLATPVFRSIKEKYPKIQLDLLIAEKSFPVVENSPFINRVYFYNSDDFDRGAANKDITYLKNYLTVSEIRKEQYDLCIGLREDLNNLCIQKMLKAKKNISFSTHTQYSDLMDETVINDDNKHAAEINYDLLKLLNIECPQYIQPEIFLTEKDKVWADEFWKNNNLSNEDIVIAISPGGGWYLNWWPYENFAELANKLGDYNRNVKIIWVGGKAEYEILHRIEEKYNGKMISAVGQTTIPQLAALYSKVRLVVTNDGGPMHVATAVKAKVLALFGPSPYKRFGPLGINSSVITKNYKCSPCPQFVKGNPNQCRSNDCMKAISVEEVFEKVVPILEEVQE